MSSNQIVKFEVNEKILRNLGESRIRPFLLCRVAFSSNIFDGFETLKLIN